MTCARCVHLVNLQGAAEENNSSDASAGVHRQSLQQGANSTDAGGMAGVMAAGWDKSRWGSNDW